ncbi:hypothetical protein U879_21050 [Defluviimonas sp. 20V17]|uniref:Uncharacterized protein n=1 Tax=Allgaiera indica TaxID=765699 RepID=A0AAN5A0E1_9RHOB|nr:hypothetical protein [Allgaiera indica]KDB01692.1 hypothetical protein U879_21050 [Defluviimonas sp. 20V17]GHE04014.1 hypothetical protein GCM10008024_29510 [Allgaiera indica]SDX34231.1 hypothetical protein SAMN05444006_11430 [Allgaiera indica]
MCWGCRVRIENRAVSDVIILRVAACLAVIVTEAAPEAPEAEESFSIGAAAVLLAHYSTVTFNGHRTHCDVHYCRAEEG